MSTRTIGVDDLARELGVSAEWVRRQCRARVFPHHRIARHLRFTDADVAAIVATMAVPVKPAAAADVVPLPPATRRYASYPARS